LFLGADVRAYLDCLVAQAVAFLQQQELLALEVRGLHALLRREAVSFRDRDQKGLVEQRARGKDLRFRRQSEDREVEFARERALDEGASARVTRYSRSRRFVDRVYLIHH
jgi:hypothetical protein